MVRVLWVGLSGGIGSGKSTVANRLREHGAMVIDADAIARDVVRPDSTGLAEVVNAFGENVLAEDGSLNRPTLAERVFGDAEARARLNGILHPLIGARTAELMAEATDDAIVVHDVPLLVENNLAPSYHLVIMVDAPEEKRVHRLVHSRGVPESDARSRIAAQASERQRRAVSDVWLNNDSAPDQILTTVDTLWVDRLVPFEANVRLGRFTAYGGPKLVPPDPQWPEIADRLGTRIEAAVGDPTATVEHIGSTSVPEMVAKDIVDLQLGVRSLAPVEDVGRALDAAGFVHLAWITHDNARNPAVPLVRRREQRDEAWRKRLHVNADPARPAIVHIREIGSPGWRYALLFRDWLCADPLARSEYQDLKQRLAAKHKGDPDCDGYTADKEPWFDEAAIRASEWAERTGWAPPE